MPAPNSAIPTVLIDNAVTRVTEWRFAVGAATGWHRHEYDYVVVPMTTGKLRIVDANDELVAELTECVPYYRQIGVEHDVINVNDFAFCFIEIEFKEAR